MIDGQRSATGRRSSMFRIALALSAASLMAACESAPRVPPPPDTGPELEALQLQQRLVPSVWPTPPPDTGWSLRERMDHYRVPGVAVAVVDDGELRFVKNWGVLTADGEEPVVDDTRFQGASIAKALTATLALRLADQGDLDLDAAVTPWLDDIDTSGVTPRRLLAHTAGLDTPSFAGYAQSESLPTLDEILRGASPATSDAIRVVVEPGTTWRYSGGGFEVLRQVIEERTSRPFAEVMDEELFAPLRMSNSSVRPLPPELEARAATGHDHAGVALPDRWRVFPEAAAAGLWTTAEDLAQWIIDLQKAHAGKPGRRLRRDMARAMFEPQDPGAWGLGVLRGGVGQSAWFAHLGGNPGYATLELGFVSSGHGIVVLTNGDGGSDLIREIVTAAAAIYDWPTFGGVVQPGIAPDASLLERAVGSWSLPALDVELTISAEDGALWAQFLGQRSRMTVTSATELRAVDRGWDLRLDAADRASVHLWPGYRFDAMRSP
ncbi:MAG: serine hydrolase domain-containing protein [Acidobacteriota bacterium]